jgi:hypothetical protein
MPITKPGEVRADGAPITDCLDRVRFEQVGSLPTTRRCIATVASRGFEGLLDRLLGSLRANAHCDSAVLVVLAVEPGPELLGIVEQHGAWPITCRALRPLSSSVKSALYSTARVVTAEQFICLDADTVVLAGVDVLFDALETHPPGSVLACADQNRRTFASLGEALERLYLGSRADLERFLGLLAGEDEEELVVNDGVFAAGRAGMLALDSTIRSMRGAPEWVDANPLRNQFLFNLAIAHMRCAVRMDDTLNLQLHAQDVELAMREGRVEARWQGRLVRVLHFNARGRGKYASWQRLLLR